LPERPARPPEIAARIEHAEGARARGESAAEVSRDQEHLGEAAAGVGSDLVEALGVGDRLGLAAVGDGNLGSASGETVEKPGPVVPGRAARRVGDRLDQIADALEGLDVLDVLTQGELDLGLLDDGVDPAQSIGVGVRHRVEALEGSVEVGDGLGVGPAPVRFPGGEQRVVHRLLRLVRAAEVMREELGHLMGSFRVEALQRRARRRVMGAPAPLEEARVRHLLGQRMLEDVHRLLGAGPLVEELQTHQLPQRVLEAGARAAPHRREQPERDLTAEHRGSLEEALGVLRQPVDARQEDLLDRLRYRQRGTGLALLGHRARQFLEKKWIALGLFDDELGDGLGEMPRGEDAAEHAHAVLRREGLERDLGHVGFVEPGRPMARPARHDEQ
jgi:hypothetical protein